MARKRIPEWLVLTVAAVLSAVYIFLGNRASKDGMDRIVSMYAQSKPVTLTVTSIEDEHYEKVM
nr:hypothetical protein [Eubacteriales bacterium]